MPTPDPHDARNRSGALFAVAVVALAVVLRAWHLRAGLPDLLEEAIPLRLALGLEDATGRIDWNPHHFHYPSLSVYLHFVVQQLTFGVGRLLGMYHNYADYLLSFELDPTPMVIPARLVGVASDAFAVWGVVRIGERLARGSGAAAGALAACSSILIVTSSAIFCDSLMTVFAVWAVERMIAWHAHLRRRDWVRAAVLVGLAAGAKYPAAALLVPLTWLAWHRQRTRGLATGAVITGLALVTCVCTTPFAVLDPRAFLRDVSFEGAHVAGGHFGSIGHASFAFHLANLASSLGWVALALVPASLPLLARDPQRRPAAIAVALSLLVFGVPISLARIDAERYLVPVVPFAAALAAAAAAALLQRIPRSRRRWQPALATLASLVLLGPAMARGVTTAASGLETTQGAARRWCEDNVGRTQLIVEEGYAAPLPSALLRQNAAAGNAYRQASDVVRARFDAVQPFHVVSLPLAVAGAITNDVWLPGGIGARLEVMPHASGLSRVFYDPRLYADADDFVTSAAVRGRYEADPERYPAECAFYRLLDARGEVAARFAPRGAVTGPEIVIYRLGPAFRDTASARGALDPHWWTAAIPAEYRARARTLVALGGDTARSSLDSGSPAWIGTLAPFYAKYIQPFAVNMATELVTLGRNEAARDYARATLEMYPADLNASLVYATCSGRLKQWDEARVCTERALNRYRRGEAEPALVLLHARALANTGATREAAREIESLLPRLGPNDPIALSARELLARVAAPARPAPTPSVVGANE